MLKAKSILVLKKEICNLLKRRTDAYHIGNTGIRENDALTSNFSLYELYDEDKFEESIGFILLDKDTPYRDLDTEYEILIGIFNKYRKNGYATACINQVVSLLPNENWNNVTIKAVVQKTNRDGKHIIKILDNLFLAKQNAKEGRRERFEDEILVEYKISAKLM